MAIGNGVAQGRGTGQGPKPGKQHNSDGRVGFLGGKDAGSSSNKMKSKMKMNKAMKVK